MPLTSQPGKGAPANLQSVLKQYVANPAAAFKAVAGSSAEKPNTLLLQVILADKQSCLRLCDDHIVSLPDAIAVTGLLQETEVSFQVKLARQAVSWAAHSGMSARAVRALTILAEVVSDHRLNPVIVQLVRSRHPKIRSKVLAIIARCCPNPMTAERYLEDDDPRVRANLIEALADCASNSAWLQEALQNHVWDRNNRIAANAAVGLFRLGETDAALTHIRRMASDERPAFRASAAWAMGAISIGELADDLERLRHDSSQTVRWNALRSLVRLHKKGNVAVDVPQP